MGTRNHGGGFPLQSLISFHCFVIMGEATGRTGCTLFILHSVPLRIEVEAMRSAEEGGHAYVDKEGGAKSTDDDAADSARAGSPGGGGGGGGGGSGGGGVGGGAGGAAGGVGADGESKAANPAESKGAAGGKPAGHLRTQSGLGKDARVILTEVLSTHDRQYNSGASKATWALDPGVGPDGDGKCWAQVTFTCVAETEKLKRVLTQFGFGSRFGVLNLISPDLTVHPYIRSAIIQKAPTANSKEAGAGGAAQGGQGSGGAAGEGGSPNPIHHRNHFIESIKSHVIVEGVVSNVEKGADFSFDFLMLLSVACVLAAMGLTLNNAVVVVSSMLVSPIMGPILAVTFGTVINRWPLVRLGIRSSMAGLTICVLWGFIMGLCLARWGPYHAWPTTEMSSRGTVDGLYYGIVVAVFSGVGVALSILGNNTSSLVGVAISGEPTREEWGGASAMRGRGTRRRCCWVMGHSVGRRVSLGQPRSGSVLDHVGVFFQQLTGYLIHRLLARCSLVLLLSFRFCRSLPSPACSQCRHVLGVRPGWRRFYGNRGRRRLVRLDRCH